MPKTGPVRAIVAFRLNDEAIKYLDRQAEGEQVDRSELIRLYIAYAGPRMPKGWRPPPRTEQP